MKNNHHQKRSKAVGKTESLTSDFFLLRLEQLAESDPADFGLLVGRIFQLLVERERKAYDFLMVKVIFATLKESGFLARFDELKQVLMAKDVLAASGIVEAIGSWTKAVEAFASTEASEILGADQVRESRTWLM